EIDSQVSPCGPDGVPAPAGTAAALDGAAGASADEAGCADIAAPRTAAKSIMRWVELMRKSSNPLASKSGIDLALLFDGAVRQGHVDEHAARAAILQRVNADFDLVARIDGVLIPAGAQHHIGAASEFYAPDLLLAFLVGDIEPDIGVRVGPLEGADGAG